VVSSSALEAMPPFSAHAARQPARLPRTLKINRVRLRSVERGSGDPIVFVHGGLSGPDAWNSVTEEIAARHPYRLITYTQRYYGTDRWRDEGRKFSVATHAHDLATLITCLDAHPAHLVGWSYGGAVATVVALKNPSLVRSLILYEPTILSVLPAGSHEAEMARKDQAKMLDPVIAATKSGNVVQAIRLMYEAVYQLPYGGFGSVPRAIQTRVLDNARTIPLLLKSLASLAVSSDALRNLGRPTLVVRGENTQTFYALIAERISECVPGARRVVLPNANHAGPARDPAAFAKVVLEFLSNP
jgi:pimeloyl-ACP methyl ester carboxylesterase